MRALWCMLCVSISFAQPVSFLPPTTINNGLGGPLHFVTNALVAADVNGDGKPDIVALNALNEAVSANLTVSLGNGDGTFQPTVTLGPATTTFTPPVVSDFNGDGRPDIAIVESVERFSLAVFLGNGDGTFQPALTMKLPFFSGNLIVADWNHDGRLDLSCGRGILLGNGDGTFTAVAGLLDGTPILTADFNHDGKPDLLITQPSENVAIILGSGDGTFGADIPIKLNFLPGSYAAGDFNGDGIVDLAISPTAPQACQQNAPLCALPVASIAILRGNGDGTFQAALTTPKAMGPILAAADLNGDGKLDLVVANSVMTGVGDGTFRFPVFFGISIESCVSTVYPQCELVSYYAAAVADFNADGRNDIIEAYGFPYAFTPAGVAILLNEGPGDGFLITGVSSASGAYPVADVSIVSAFGVDLAPSTASALDPSLPPTTLGGIRVHLFDRLTGSDQLAPLFLVSPTQINFEISISDSSAVNTFVYIGIERVGSPYIPKGMILPIQAFQVGLYSLNSSGLAAANAVRLSADGSQTPVSVASCADAGCVSVPIAVTAGPVYLSLYGTGFGSLSTADSICLLAGISAEPATYFGPQLVIPGLDQVNLLLPASLAGKGDVAISCNDSNLVHVNIQ